MPPPRRAASFRCAWFMGRLRWRFAEDFVWGAASSAYQTEGFPTADGGGESVWDVFCRQPGAIANGEDGSVACDGYHRFEEDIGLLAALGLSRIPFFDKLGAHRPERRRDAGTKQGSATMTAWWTAVCGTASRHG